MAVYDSAKIRDAAKLMGRLTGSVNADVLYGLRAARELRTEFRGRTAQAMEEELEQLMKAARDIEDEIGALAAKLGRYADMLEEADAQLAKEL